MPREWFRLERPEILRTLYISFLSVLIGTGAGLIGTLLYRLINFVTGLLYHREGHHQPFRHHPLPAR